MNEKEIGIYIHIPFCKQKCYYCDFVSYSNKKEKIENYIKALEKEIEHHKNILRNRIIDTIYIGGGTPSYIDSNLIVEILEKLKQNIKIKENIEITIEINPGTINIEKLEDYKKIGINRISMGVQSTNNKLLKEIGRIHNKLDVIKAYELMKKIGFDNKNLDFIIGLPNQTLEDIEKEIEFINELQPEHISMYSLIIEEGTIISDLIKKGILELPKEDDERNMYWKFKEKLEKIGYQQYEISNFAKKGKESIHNLHCWEQKEYIGFGVAAHSYLNNTRYSNIEPIEEYCKNIYEKKWEENKIIQEVQNKEEKMNEYILLGLRKIKGINSKEFFEKFEENLMEKYIEKLKRLERKGLIKIEKVIADTNTCYYKINLTKTGLDFANLVFKEFV